MVVNNGAPVHDPWQTALYTCATSSKLHNTGLEHHIEEHAILATATTKRCEGKRFSNRTIILLTSVMELASIVSACFLMSYLASCPHPTPSQTYPWGYNGKRPESLWTLQCNLFVASLELCSGTWLLICSTLFSWSFKHRYHCRIFQYQRRFRAMKRGVPSLLRKGTGAAGHICKKKKKRPKDRHPSCPNVYLHSRQIFQGG